MLAALPALPSAAAGDASALPCDDLLETAASAAAAAAVTIALFACTYNLLAAAVGPSRNWVVSACCVVDKAGCNLACCQLPQECRAL